MNAAEGNRIVLGLASILALVFIISIGNKDGGSEDPNYDGLIEDDTSLFLSEAPRGLPDCQSKKTSPMFPSRQEILMAKVKGYRSYTYWGEYTSLDDELRYLGKEEFEDFIENVELSDPDVYWGVQH